MDDEQRSGAQAALWNGDGGRGWVATSAVLDELFRPIERLLLDAVPPAARHALDVGCGTGSTTVAVARRLGPGGSAVGIDVSAPMLAAARARADREGVRATFVVADAQTHPLEPARFDAILSRFGVMFFDDAAAAFANLRRAARPGAALCCVAWRGAAENPFMTAAERAAAPLLSNLPTRRPNEPGPFAFSDRDRVRGVLEDSGWSAIDVRPVDVPCTMPARALPSYLAELGPVGRALQNADDTLRARVLDAVLPAFAPYVRGAEVHITAACWRIAAQA